MNIHQISVNYVPEQDRCLVRINSQANEELRLWFTRRLTLGLLPHLNKTAAEQMQRHTAPAALAAPVEQQREHMLSSFQKEQAAYKGDYQTPFKSDAPALPLGELPLLISEVKLTLLPNGKVELQLLEKSPEQVRNIALAMNPQLVQGMKQLLTEAVKKSDWLAVPAAAEPPMVQGDVPSSLLEQVEKPRYLN